MYAILSAGDDGLLVTFDGYDAVFAVVIDAGREGLIQHFRRLTHLHYTELQCAMSEVQVIAHPVGAKTLFNLVRSQYLRIDQVGQTHVLKELLILRQQVFVVIDTRQGALRSQGVSYQTGGHVLRLMWSNGDK